MNYGWWIKVKIPLSEEFFLLLKDNTVHTSLGKNKYYKGILKLKRIKNNYIKS